MLRRALNHTIALWRMKQDPIAYARGLGVSVGKDCRLLALTPGTFGSEPYLVSLGDHVTITEGVRFVTHDGGVWVFRQRDPDIEVFGPITVGNNVFIGLGVVVMPGVSIGADCVIGAGAVVTRSVPDGTVTAGVPAKPIGTTEAYRHKVTGKASHIRSLPAREKRDVLEHMFERHEQEER